MKFAIIPKKIYLKLIGWLAMACDEACDMLHVPDTRYSIFDTLYSIFDTRYGL